MMKKLFRIFAVILVLSGGLWLTRKSIYRFIVTDQLNDEISVFKLQDLDGTSIHSSDYKGKILVLDFWTTTCGACISSFPDFQKVFDKYQSHPEVAFFAVNTSHGGDSIEKVRTFVERNHYTFPIAYDTAAALSNKFEVKYYPTLIIIDRTGKPRFKHIGYSKTLENYEALISNYIEELLGNNQSYHTPEILRKLNV